MDNYVVKVNFFKVFWNNFINMNYLTTLFKI